MTDQSTKFKSWQEINLFLLQNNNKDPLATIEELLVRFDTESYDLRHYQLIVSGERYNASINAAFAQSIIDFQKSFNEIVNSLYKNVKKNQRENIEVYFTFKNGSSLINSDDIFNLIYKLCETVFNKMNSQHIMYIAAFIILCFSSYKLAELYFKYRSNLIDKQIKKAEHDAMLQDKQDERNFLLQLLANKKVKATIETAGKEGISLRQKIIDASPKSGIDSIEINGEVLHKDEIYNLQTHKEETPCAEFIVTEKFKIINFSIPDNKKVRLEVRRQNAPKAPAFTLYGKADEKGALTAEEIGYICDAIKENKQIIELQAKLYVEGSVAIKGEIIAFTNEAPAAAKGNMK